MTAQTYIDRVLAHLPQATPLRTQIAVELRGSIDERVAHGEPLADVLGQLGDPLILAESYLAAVPLVPAPLGLRVWAKMIDVLAVVAVVAIPAAVAFVLLEQPFRFFAAAEAIILAIVGYAGYTILAEWTRGQTIGKRMAGLHVVRESGAPITLGQAVVRLLPLFLQIAWIDALAIPFTDRRQRLFELLSKTRVVCTGAQEPATVEVTAVEPAET
jgi:uncharacterized RDD family membrane protein YckC